MTRKLEEISDEFWAGLVKLEQERELAGESRDYYQKLFQDMAKKARDATEKAKQAESAYYTKTCESTQKDYMIDELKAGLKQATKVIDRIRKAVAS